MTSVAHRECRRLSYDAELQYLRIFARDSYLSSTSKHFKSSKSPCKVRFKLFTKYSGDRSTKFHVEKEVEISK